MFAGSGEKLADFDMFHPDRMASRILDLGDLLTLIEQAERTFDAEQAAEMAGRLAAGEGFTLEDFVEQLAMVRKLGPIGNLLGMLPGAAQNREALSQISDKDLDRAAAIVNSMTVEERRNPKIINGSRRARIAAGSGVAVGEVSQLIVRFLEGQKMMRQMMGSMPGMGGMRRSQKSKGKGKKRSGKGGGRPAGRPALGQGSLAQQAGAAPAGLGQASGLTADQSGRGGGLPGFSALPGGLDDLPFKLPDGRQGQSGGAGLPPGLRGRPGKKGR
jgi:signal recognition particle subunit SRP54